MSDRNGSILYVVSFVYGLHHVGERKRLWTELGSIVDQLSCPWIVIGDFNSIFGTDQRIGGAEVMEAKIKVGCSFLIDHNVSCLRSVGHYFSWQQNVKGILSRIDHVVANEEWRLSFEDSRVDI